MLEAERLMELLNAINEAIYTGLHTERYLQALDEIEDLNDKARDIVMPFLARSLDSA